MKLEKTGNGLISWGHRAEVGSRDVYLPGLRKLSPSAKTTMHHPFSSPVVLLPNAGEN